MITIPKQADSMVGFWVWVDGKPLRIEHVQTYVAGKLESGKDDVRHNVVLRDSIWDVTSRAERSQVTSSPNEQGQPSLPFERATEEQQAALESATALIPLSNTIACFLTSMGATSGAGPILTDDVLETVTKLENQLRIALRRRSHIS